MPPEREEPHRLDPLDDDDELDAGVGLLRLSDVRVHLRRHELAGQRSSGNEVAGEVDPEPCAELPSVRDRAPNALEARAEPYLLLDAIGDVCHRQPPGCSNRIERRAETQPKGCASRLERGPTPEFRDVAVCEADLACSDL